MKISERLRRSTPALYLATLAAGVGIGACMTQQPGPTAGPGSPERGGFFPAANAAPPYDPSGEPVVKALQKSAPAVVSIDTAAQRTFLVPEDDFDAFFGRGRVERREVPTGAGSGVLLDGGYVLTNQHVVGGAVGRNGSIRVTLADGRRFPATAVGADYSTDIALLKVDTKEKLPQIPLGTDDALVPGQTVIAIGNPVGLSASVSSGVVSALGRPLSMEGRVYENLIQTDTAINPGNSGGALVDLGGNLVGINTLVRADAQNIGFAIPVRTALRIAAVLKTEGRVRRPTPGLVTVELDSRLANSIGVPPGTRGVVVWLLYRGGPADEAGLRRGDVITAIEGKAVTDEASYRRVLEGLKIGQEVTLSILRGDRTATARVRLIESQQ